MDYGLLRSLRFVMQKKSSNLHKLVFENSFNLCKKNRKLCTVLLVVCANSLLLVVLTDLFSNSEPAPDLA